MGLFNSIVEDMVVQAWPGKKATEVSDKWINKEIKF